MGSKEILRGTTSRDGILVAIAAMVVGACSQSTSNQGSTPGTATARFEVIRPLPQHMALVGWRRALSASFVREDGRVVMGVSRAVLTSPIDEIFRWESGVGTRGLGYPAGIDPSVSSSVDLGAGPMIFSRDGAAVAAAIRTGTAGETLINLRWSEPEGMAPLPLDRVNGISDDGTVLAGNAGQRAVRWTADAGSESLAPPPDVAVLRTVAAHVSRDGQIIIGQFIGAELRFFWWTAATGMVILEPPHTVLCPMETTFGADGQTILATCAPPLDPAQPDEQPRAEIVRWRPASSVTRDTLGVPSGFERALIALLSPDGSAIFGLHATDDLRASAVHRWREQSGWMAVEKLPGAVGCSAGARGISGDGRVVVGLCEGPTFRQAFQWTEATGTRRLDPPPGMDTGSVVNVSADGKLVAGWAGAPSGLAAVLWDVQLRPRRVDELLIERGADLQGVRLLQAQVSADGSTLVGEGEDGSGDQVVWVARLVE